MQTNFPMPPIFQAVIGILSSLALAAALASFVMAGVRLRAEGGVNYEAGGGFFKWMLWGAIFLTLPGITAWLASEGIPVYPVTYSAPLPVYVQQIVKAASDFVFTILVDRIVPVLAATLVFKAILDTAEGRSPLPSTIAALFLLGVKGLYNLANSSWMEGANPYATTDMLQSMFLYLAYTLSPLIGALCISGAILRYVGNKPWGHLVFTGLGFLSVPGLWALVKAMAGVTLSW